VNTNAAAESTDFTHGTRSSQRPMRRGKSNADRTARGHPRAGETMEVPAYAADFLRNAMTVHESALCAGRKNGKSAICAILALGYLVDPLRQEGFRMAIARLSKEKANELRSHGRSQWLALDHSQVPLSGQGDQ